MSHRPEAFAVAGRSDGRRAVLTGHGRGRVGVEPGGSRPALRIRLGLVVSC